MTAYCIIFAIIFLLQFRNVNTEIGYLNRTLLTFGVLFLYGGLRTDCNDFEAYESFYDVAYKYGVSAALDYNDHMEYGWAVLSHLFPSFRSLVVTQTLFFCGIYAYLTYKYVPAKYSWTIVLMLFITGDKSIMFMYSAMRNSVAISMLLLSFLFMLRKNWYVVIVLAIAASTVHTSALVFIPVSAILACLAYWKEQMSKVELFFWIVLLFALVVFPINSMLEPFTVVFMQDDLSRYQDVVSSQYTSAGAAATYGSVLLSVGVLYYIYNYARTIEENIIGRLSLLLTYSYLLGSLNVRVTQYFIMFFVLCMVFICKCNMSRIIKIAYFAFVLLFFGYALFVVELNSPYCRFTLFESFI